MNTMHRVSRGHHHWVTVALVLAALLLTLTEVHGQSMSTGSSAMFQGRPEIAGAQGGLGAQAGLPQGGLGVQGSDRAELSLNRSKPSDLDTYRRATHGTDVAAANSTAANAAAPVDSVVFADRDRGIAKKSDDSLAKDQRSAVRKTARATKRVIQRARYGVSPIDATARAGS